MAQLITYTVEDLKMKMSELLMECAGRAKREDLLISQIAVRDREIEELKAKLDAKSVRTKKGE